MLDFALGFLCATVLYATIWWRVDSKATLDTVQPSAVIKDNTKSPILRQILTTRPNNALAQEYMSPQKVREKEEEVHKGAVEYYE